MKLRSVLSFLSLLLLSNTVFASGIEVTRPLCEMRVDPTAIDIQDPRFSWQIESNERAVKQIGYQVLVASSPALLSAGKADMWNSGKVISDQSVLVPYKGKALQSGRKYFWMVKVFCNKGTDESPVTSFGMGLLKPSDWKAKWIGLDRAFPWDSVTKFSRLSARYFRKEISLQKKLQSARVYISGLGLYELYINGSRIGDQVLAPAPTDYSKTSFYNVFDVTTQLKSGANALGITLGNGRFFTMRQNYKPQKWHTFGFPKLLLQLELQFTDGSRQVVVSDESWKVTSDGPIRTNNEYDGEEYDATKELTGWEMPGYKADNWLKAELVKAPGGVLRAQPSSNMKVMETVAPKSITKLTSGVHILDMGQNMAGWIRMKVRGNRSQKVKLRFAESLQKDGSLYTANLRDAIVTDEYTLRGGGDESWAPRFVYHGFRYVEVTGYPGEPTTADFSGEVVYDDIATTGIFESSSAMLNSIHQNAWWGIRSNYKGMPVDCPQRNERQPWLGDRTMGAYGESFLFDNGNLYAKWLNDLRDAQTDKGSIPDVAPSFWYYYKDNMTWPGAYLTIADMLYQQFGDARPIISHYPSMKKWLYYMKGKYLTPGYIMTKDSYGDWCVPPESPELIHSRDSTRTTDPKLIATAYYYYFLGRMQEFARLAGKAEDVAAYRADALKVREAFNKTFYASSSARYSNNTVTANLLALAFRLVPEGDSLRVFQNIVETIEVKNAGHISTGVIGTQWIMRWLTAYGRSDLAYRMASVDTYPGWGYMVKNGATTIWELWNGNTANPAMNSQNHVMLLGDLLIWMYEDLAGIRSSSAAKGFKKIVMKAHSPQGLTEVNASHLSPYGSIRSHWKREGNRLNWSVSIPPNTSAEIYLLDGGKISEDGKDADKVEGMRLIRKEKGFAVYELQSGNYELQQEGGTI